MKQLILDKISEMTKSKIDGKKDPPFALSRELYRELENISPDEFKKSINELAKEGKIDFGNTINDIYVKIKDDGRASKEKAEAIKR